MELPDINKRINILIDKYSHGSQQAFANDIGVSQGTINRLYHIDSRTGKYPTATKNTIEKIIRKFPAVSKEWIIKGNESNNIDFTINEPPISYETKKDEVKAAPLKGITKIHLVENTNVMAGWLDTYYADEYLEQLPVIKMPTENNHSGLYLGFKVINDSMEPEYYEGDIVVGREVSRLHWKNKLHIKEWDFIIAHNTSGVLIKEIVNHDPETGDITLHSLNDNYNDFVVNLREVSRIFNVVDHRPDVRKRRLRRES